MKEIKVTITANDKGEINVESTVNELAVLHLTTQASHLITENLIKRNHEASIAQKEEVEQAKEEAEQEEAESEE